MKGGLKAVADAYAESVIKSVMEEWKIYGQDFWESTVTQCVGARRDAIKRLQKEGFTYRHIAEAMKCRIDTVQYHMSYTVAQGRRNRRNKRYAIEKAAEARA